MANVTALGSAQMPIVIMAGSRGIGDRRQGVGQPHIRTWADPLQAGTVDSQSRGPIWVCRTASAILRRGELFHVNDCIFRHQPRGHKRQ